MNLSTFEIIQLLLTLMGTLLIFYFRKKDNEDKKLYYISKNKTIINNESGLNKLKVTYNDNLIKRLTQTEILIFNKKSKTIKYKELGKKTGLKLMFSKKTKIFNSKIVDYDNPNINFEQKINENIQKFTFDYFKKGNFVHIKILSNEPNESFPKLIGEFIENGTLTELSSYKFKSLEFKRIIPFILIFSAFLSFISRTYEIKEWILLLISLAFGYVILDILRLIQNKKIDKRILEIIYE